VVVHDQNGDFLAPLPVFSHGLPDCMREVGGWLNRAVCRLIRVLWATPGPHQQSLQRLPRQFSRVEHVTVEVQGQARVRVSDTLGEGSDGDAFVVPDGGSTVPQLVRGEPGNPLASQ
jgi:hypothetical protein